jgi:hypothetical protein
MVFLKASDISGLRYIRVKAFFGTLTALGFLNVSELNIPIRRRRNVLFWNERNINKIERYSSLGQIILSSGTILKKKASPFLL